MNTPIYRLPIDFSTLELGSVVPTTDLERFTQLPSSHKQFAVRCLPLLKQIEDHFRSTHGQDVCVVYRKETLVILKDKDASEYTHRELKSSTKRMNKLVRKSLAVDTAKLTGDEKRVHEHRSLAWAKVVSALNASKKESFRLFTK